MRQLKLIAGFPNFSKNLKRAKLAQAEVGRGLMDLDVFGAEPDHNFRLEDVGAFHCSLVTLFMQSLVW